MIFQSLLFLMTPTVSCPLPISVLANRSLSAVVSFEATTNGERNIFTVTRRAKGFAIEYQTNSAPSAPSRYQIFSKEMSLSGCNSISVGASDIDYFLDSALSLLVGYCLNDSPDSVWQTFWNLRVKPPETAEVLRASHEVLIAEKCPSMVKALEMLKQLRRGQVP